MIKNKIFWYLILIVFVVYLFFANGYIAHGEEFSYDAVYKVPAPCAKYLDEVEKYNWSTATVIKIMYLESKCNPKAFNATDSHRGCKGSTGLLQVACIHKGGDKLDPEENIKMAYEVYKKAGYSFKPWTTYKKIK